MLPASQADEAIIEGLPSTLREASQEPRMIDLAVFATYCSLVLTPCVVALYTGVHTHIEEA